MLVQGQAERLPGVGLGLEEGCLPLREDLERGRVSAPNSELDLALRKDVSPGERTLREEGCLPPTQIKLLSFLFIAKNAYKAAIARLNVEETTYEGAAKAAAVQS